MNTHNSCRDYVAKYTISIVHSSKICATIVTAMIATVLAGAQVIFTATCKSIHKPHSYII